MATPRKLGAAAAIGPSVSYLGQHLRGVDNGRVIIPPEWRPAGSPQDLKVVLWPVTKWEYVLVLPPSRWEFLQKSLEGLPLSDAQAAVVERLISSSTFARSMDSYGRLQLPEQALPMVGPGSEALLVGRMNKFEIWNPRKYAAALAAQDVPSITDTIKTIRI